MFKAVLFDLDGTLLYTLTDVADAMNKALVHFGYPPHPVDAYKYFIGESVETEARRALPESARDPEFSQKSRGIFRRNLRQMLGRKHTPIPGHTGTSHRTSATRSVFGYPLQ